MRVVRTEDIVEVTSRPVREEIPLIDVEPEASPTSQVEDERKEFNGSKGDQRGIALETCDG